LAVLLALVGTALSYLALGVVLGLAAGWSRPVAVDQAYGLALHAGVVFVRGVLPTVAATSAACLLWRRWRGSDPGAGGTLVLALALAALVTLAVLTARIGDWPRLEVKRAPDAAVTIALLAGAGAGADLLARRLLRRRRVRLR
jgi:hypothetical protein